MLLVGACSCPAHGAEVAYDGGIVLNCGEVGYSEGGAWETVTGSYYTAGQSWTDVRSTGQDGAWAEWAPTLPAAGKYRVYFWHVPGNDASAKIEIAHDGKVETSSRDMQLGHIGWTSLGDYDFAAADGGYLKITRGVGKLMVNSVKFLPVEKIRPLPVLQPYPKPDGSAPHFDDRGNLLISGTPYQALYQELLETTVCKPETIPTMDETFDTALAQGVNTLGVTLMWNRFESAEGVYDYRVIDALIEKARARRMHLDLVLFFAWRNLQSFFVPDYISKDHKKYLTVKRADGSENGYVLSPFGDATREAETRALQALFDRVKRDDPDHQIVIIAQLENEMPGLRDFSPPAKEAWSGAVPADLTACLAANDSTIDRLIWEVWHRRGAKSSGTWAEVFGTDDHAERIFAAWEYGRYVEQVATAIKKELPIPLYANAWRGESPCYHQCMDIFHAAAPDLDGMGPDAYGNLDDWEKEVGLSVRAANRLTIAEQHHSTNTIWRAIANYNAAISGQYYDVEGGDWLCSLETDQLIEQMEPVLAEQRGTGNLWGFFQNRHVAGESWSEYLQDLRLTFTATVRPHTWSQFNKEVPAPCEKVNNITGGELDGCGLLIALGNGEYIATSTRIDLTLGYINGGPIDVAEAESGHFENGAWVKDGEAQVQRGGDSVRIAFPTENRRYGQVRFKLAAPAANPAQVYEAEKGKRLGDVNVDYNGAASGAFYVMPATHAGEGVEWATHAPFEARAITIRYAADTPCHLALVINGASVAGVDFSPTGSSTNWDEKTLTATIPSGATVMLRKDQGASGPSLDCMILSASVPTAQAKGP